MPSGMLASTPETRPNAQPINIQRRHKVPESDETIAIARGHLANSRCQQYEDIVVEDVGGLYCVDQSEGASRVGGVKDGMFNMETLMRRPATSLEEFDVKIVGFIF